MKRFCQGNAVGGSFHHYARYPFSLRAFKFRRFPEEITKTTSIHSLHIVQSINVSRIALKSFQQRKTKSNKSVDFFFFFFQMDETFQLDFQHTHFLWGLACRRYWIPPTTTTTTSLRVYFTFGTIQLFVCVHTVQSTVQPDCYHSSYLCYIKNGTSPLSFAFDAANRVTLPDSFYYHTPTIEMHSQLYMGQCIWRMADINDQTHLQNYQKRKESPGERRNGCSNYTHADHRLFRSYFQKKEKKSLICYADAVYITCITSPC